MSLSLTAVAERANADAVEGRLEIELFGDLADMLAFSADRGANKNGPVPVESAPLLSLVAGARNRLDLLLVG